MAKKGETDKAIARKFRQIPLDEISGEVTLNFSITFKRNVIFFDSEDGPHDMYMRCYLCHRPPSNDLTISPIKTDGLTDEEIAKTIANYRRARTQLSVVLAMCDAEFDYTVSTLHSETTSTEASAPSKKGYSPKKIKRPRA